MKSISMRFCSLPSFALPMTCEGFLCLRYYVDNIYVHHKKALEENHYFNEKIHSHTEILGVLKKIPNAL